MPWPRKATVGAPAGNGCAGNGRKTDGTDNGISGGQFGTVREKENRVPLVESHLGDELDPHVGVSVGVEHLWHNRPQRANSALRGSESLGHRRVQYKVEREGEREMK